MPKFKSALSLAVAAGLVVAACGDDDDAGGATTTAGGDVATTSGAATTEGAATTVGPATTAAVATTSGAATTTPGTSAGDCTLDEPLTIGYAADFSDLAGFADVPGYDSGPGPGRPAQRGGRGRRPGRRVHRQGAARRSVRPRSAPPRSSSTRAPTRSSLLRSATTACPLIDTVNGQVPIISNASTDLDLADPSRGAFLMSFSDPVQAAAAAEFAADGGATTAVTFSSPDDAYFTNTTAAFTEAFTETGGEVVRDFTFSLADEDFSAQVNEIASLDTPPDVLYTAMIMPGTGVLLEQLEAAGLGDIQVIGADAFDATLVWTAGDVANGVSFTAHTFPTTDNGVQEFLDAATAAGAEIDTVSFGALASDVVKVFAHAAETRVLARRGDADRHDLQASPTSRSPPGRSPTPAPMACPRRTS